MKDLQSRREFFKSAAKAALPIVGALVLTSVPAVVKAAEVSDCGYTCSSGCTGCSGSCSGACSGCSGSCSGYCTGTSK